MMDLERGLHELGRDLDYPTGEGLSERVRWRLAHELSPRRRRLRRAVLLAAALAVLAAGTAVAVRFALPGVDIAPSPTPLPVSPAPPGEGLDLGRKLSLERAASAVQFPVGIPAALGDPAAVYLDGSTPGGRVSLVYEPTDRLPRDPRTGLGALLTTFHADVDEEILLGKVPEEGTLVERVTVDGSDGFWLTGEPHTVYYRGEGGGIFEDSIRLAGNVLLWNEDGVTHRLEADISLHEAIRIAESLR